MECPICKSVMEKGMLTADSTHWMKEEGFIGGVNKTMNPGFGLERVVAWKCPNCKKVELSAE